MAGSVMTFTEVTHGSVKKIKAAWTSDDTTGAKGLEIHIGMRKP